MFDEAISILSLWASMHSWLTPTVLFLLLNLMIGTIVITSGFSSSKPHHHHHDTAVRLHQHLHQPPQITRAPSVIQRLKSINFHSYYSHFQPNVHQVPTPSQKSSPIYDPLPKPAPELLARVQVKDTISHEDISTTIDDIDGPTMDDIYNKIKGTTPTTQYGRQNSDTKPTGGEIPVKLPAKMKKSASHKSPFNHFQPLEELENVAPVKPVKERVNVPKVPKAAAAAAAVGGDEEVDTKADDFINKFRQQLKLQRIESILRYKDMITRSTAK